MKTNFWQFIADIIRKHDLRRRLISVLCILSLVVSAGVSLLLTLPGMTLTTSLDPAANDAGVNQVVVDAASHNGWIDYFQIGTNTYNTEFVGSVWTDKSVFTSYKNYLDQEVAKAADGNMLGVLSAIGSSQAITGRIYTPTDVMLILDLSSSMYYNSGTKTWSSTTVKAMVDAVNNSINTLLSLNDYNRIGVVVYYGGNQVGTNYGSTTDHSKVLLPLERYKIQSTYVNFDTTNYIVSASARVEETNELKGESYGPMPQPAGTYAQLGIQNARKQFLGIAKDDTTVEIFGEDVKRQPVFIFMSDGRPTASTQNYANVGNATFGLNSETYRTSDASDFVFQLASSYAKEAVGAHYNLEPLFYTLGLGVDKVSLNAMDPMGTNPDVVKSTAEKTDEATITEWWEKLIASGSVTVDVRTNSSQYDWSELGWGTRTVGTATYKLNDGSTAKFPTSIDQMAYVDKYYPAERASDLSNAFESIVNEIILRSVYTPTQSDLNSVNQSGDVTFIDQIGQYMEIKEMKGIMMGGELHTGAHFASIFQSEEKAVEVLGKLGNSSTFGLMFWHNIMDQLRITKTYATVAPDGTETGTDVPAVKAASDLITAAWTAGQLSYTSDTEFSNYIGWYQGTTTDGTKDAYLGFWNDRDPNDSAPTGATARIKTYFFQNKIQGDANQTYDTDMMYTTVWVKEDIVDGKPTGTQTVVFIVPASLLPTLKYFVKLDTNGKVESFHLGSVDADTVFKDGKITTRPIRLIYEVGLRSDIDKTNLSQKVDSTYISNNSDPDTGQVYFYSNEWERKKDANGEHSTYGYNMLNTYSYFRPSTFNDRYYYVEDVPVYFLPTDRSADDINNFVLYNPSVHGALSTELNLYTQHPKYVRNKADDGNAATSEIEKTVYYMPIGDNIIKASSTTMKQDTDGTWYVLAGARHELDVTTTTTTTTTTRFEREKLSDGTGDGANPTGTLKWRNAPTQVVNGSDFILGSTLGNNGRIALVPDGQTLQKWLVDSDGNPYPAETAQTFEFIFHEGPKIEGVDYADAKSIGEELLNSGLKYTKITLTVAEGKYYSDVVPLQNLTEYVYDPATDRWAPAADTTEKWGCTFGREYTLVELNTNYRYDFGKVQVGETVVSGKETAEVYTGDNRNHVYQFTYGVYPEGDEDHIIRATNYFKPWEILLTKTDNNTEGQTNNLPGAVFGLYSPKSDEAMTDVPTEYSQKATIQADDPGTAAQDSVTWYLSQIGTTDENGQITWSGLTHEVYYIVELSPPPGYYAPEEGMEKDRWYVQRENEDPVKVTVANTPGVELPSTGGIGSEPYIFIGAAMMLTSAVLMVVYLGKRKEEPASS